MTTAPSHAAGSAAAPLSPLPFAPSAAVAVPPEPCRNCGAARAGAYCCQCGQHFLDDRLTFRLLVRELLERLTFDRGLLHTVKEMTRNPGEVVRNYVSGQRRRYVSPFTYLFLGAALTLLTFPLYEAEMTEFMRAQMTSDASAQTLPFTPQQADAYATSMVEVSKHTATTSLFMCVPFALLLRLLFRRSGINVAESFVFSLFTFGHVLVIVGLLFPLVILLMPNPTTYVWATFIPYVLICAHAATSYFGRPVGAVLKVCLALMGSYAVLSLVLGIGTALYVLLRYPA